MAAGGCTRKNVDWKWNTEIVATGGIVHNNHEQSKGPQHKEEYVPPDKIEEFRKEILKAGRHLAVVSSPRFPDSEKVSKAIEKVLKAVKDFKLAGMWVTFRMSNTEEEYATTKDICEASLCMFSLLINAMRNF